MENFNNRKKRKKESKMNEDKTKRERKYINGPEKEINSERNRKKSEDKLKQKKNGMI